MKYIFFATTALMNDYGKYSYKERLNQLVGTIQSINKYAPGSEIVIIDTSFYPLPKEDINLLSAMTKGCLLLHENAHIQAYRQLYEKEGPTKGLMFAIKTNCETVGLLAMMEWLEKENTEKYDRVFKITGRYRLFHHFTTIDFTLAKGKFWCGPETPWDRKIFPTRLWSFDFEMIPTMKQFFKDVYEYIPNKDGKTFNVLEQAFHAVLLRNKVPMITMEHIGLEGHMFDGHFVRE